MFPNYFDQWWGWVCKKAPKLWASLWIKIAIAVVLIAGVIFLVQYAGGKSSSRIPGTETAISAPGAVAPSTEGPTSSSVGEVRPSLVTTAQEVVPVAKKPVRWKNQLAALGILVLLILLIPVTRFAWKKIKQVSSAGLPNEWYKNPTAFAILGVIIINLVFRFSAPETWWSWFAGQRLFWTINLSIILAVFFLSFENRTSRLVGVAILGLAIWNAGNVTGYRQDLIRWQEKRDTAIAVRTALASTPTEYQLKWSKSPGFKGGDSNVREEASQAQIVRCDDQQFDIILTYFYYSGNGGSTNMTWNKAKDPEKGEWHRQNPPASGKWYLKETSKNHFVGEWMDDRYPGKWMPLSMYPAPATR